MSADDENLQDHDLLIRLDSRLGHVEDLLATFVTKMQFKPVEMISYGLAGGVLLTVLGAVLGKVLSP